MSESSQQINEIDKRVRYMEEQSTRNTEQMAALLGGISDLSSDLSGVTRELRETVLAFREYTVKHDTLKESNSKLWDKYEKLAIDTSIRFDKTSKDHADKFDKLLMDANLKHEKQNDAIAKINLTNAKNQEVINSVVAIKNKVMGIVVLAILSPISIGAAIFFNK